MGLGPMELIVCLLVALLVVVSYRIAARKGYPAALCAVLAIFIGPLVLLVLVVAPDRSATANR